MIAGFWIEFVPISWPLKAIHRFIISKGIILNTKRTGKNVQVMFNLTGSGIRN
jgi:hypothetical protein